MSKYIDEKTKKILIAFGIVIGGIFLIVLLVTIVSKIKGNSLSYNEIENTLSKAGKTYFRRNKELLPQADGETNEIMDSILVQEGLMKEISKYQKNKNVSCSGKVVVTKSGDYYDYSPYLECGDAYTTKYLYDKLLDDMVDNGDGLYAMDQYYDNKSSKVYIYRGEYPKNYVSLSEKLWRILKINPFDNSISLILSSFDKKLYRATVVWDNRYNTEAKNSSGINIYEKSRIYSWLKAMYEDTKYLDISTKQKLVSRKICLGSRSTSDNNNNGSIECSKMSDYKEFISLLPVFDFINASLDNDCSKTLSPSCSNYNYLSKFSNNWWLLTGNSRSSYEGFVASSTISERRLSNYASIRPVITLNEHTIFAGGTGTSQDPYVIR